MRRTRPAFAEKEQKKKTEKGLCILAKNMKEGKTFGDGGKRGWGGKRDAGPRKMHTTVGGEKKGYRERNDEKRKKKIHSKVWVWFVVARGRTPTGLCRYRLNGREAAQGSRYLWPSEQPLTAPAGAATPPGRWYLGVLAR